MAMIGADIAQQTLFLLNLGPDKSGPFSWPPQLAAPSHTGEESFAADAIMGGWRSWRNLENALTASRIVQRYFTVLVSECRHEVHSNMRLS